MKLARLFLIFCLLLLAYCAVLIAILIPWGWVIIALIAIAVMAKKRGSWHAFGTARWADIGHLRGMVEGGKGLIVGEIEDKTSLMVAAKALFDGSVPASIACSQFLQSRKKPPRKLVRLNRAVHTAIFAPTGVGKGVSCVIPFLLTNDEPCIVVDFKGENFQITAEARRRMGHQIVVLDPFKAVTQTPDTFNPLDFIDGDNPLALDEIRDIAAALVIRTGQEKEPHWPDSAELWIGAMVATIVAFAEDKDKSLQSVRDLLTATKKMEGAVKLMCESTVWNGMLARFGHQVAQFKDKELGSTLTTTNRHLRFLDTLAVFDSTKTSSFNPAHLLKGKMTIYLVIPPEFMTPNAALLRLWIGSMLRAVIRGGLQDRTKVHFILDEAASLGHMSALVDAIDKYRGYGVRLQLYYQSLGQLKRSWPEGSDQTLLSNVSQVYFGVNDNETAKLVSERLGKETLVIWSGGSGKSSQSSSQTGQGGGSKSYSSGTSHNDNWQQTGRELLQPSEVMNLPERIAIIFTPGVPPIWTTLVRYYEAGFRSSLRPSYSRFKVFCQATLLLLAAAMCAFGLTMLVQQQISQSRAVANPQFLVK